MPLELGQREVVSEHRGAILKFDDREGPVHLAPPLRHCRVVSMSEDGVAEPVEVGKFTRGDALRGR